MKPRTANSMNIQIFGTKKCNDTKKAQRFFKERGIKFQFIDMKEKGMSKGEFNSVAQVNGGLDNMINWDGTEQCGYYECKECGSRFLDLKIAPTLVCPYCGEEADMEIGPDEEMPKVVESAKLIQMVRGVEEVEKMDKLLSLAVTGGDFSWI